MNCGRKEGEILLWGLQSETMSLLVVIMEMPRNCMLKEWKWDSEYSYCFFLNPCVCFFLELGLFT